MKIEAKYCQFCGEELDANCDCLREIAEAEEAWIEDYCNRPETQYGWMMQDMIESGHFNQR